MNRNAIATQAAQQGCSRFIARCDRVTSGQVDVDTAWDRIVGLFGHIDVLQVGDAVDKVQPRLKFSSGVFSRSYPYG
ncbi:MAG: hypothetical protein OEU60_03870 [Gammaproteobacteria bacterium]|jgi:hypothetical protein|nr:hypothetical protein [Gammaproteobacteria bacterium]